MRKGIKGILAFTIIGCLSVLVLMPSTNVSAAQASAEFELTPILPKNQNVQVQNHFSVNVRPQRSQTLQVIVTNLTDHKLKIFQSTGNAYTKMNGEISTNKPTSAINFTTDSALKYPFINSFRIVGPKEITLAPHARTTVSGTFIGNVDLRFAGLIMGGWNFETKHANQRVATQQSMWIDLHVTKRVQPNIILKNVMVERQRHHENLVTHIQNPVPGLFHGTVNTTILNDKKQIVSQVEYPRLQIAPNSNFDLDVLAAGVHLQPGKYTLKIDAENVFTKQQWHLTRQITIAKSGRHQAVTSDKQPFPWWCYCNCCDYCS